MYSTRRTNHDMPELDNTDRLIGTHVAMLGLLQIITRKRVYKAHQVQAQTTMGQQPGHTHDHIATTCRLSLRKSAPFIRVLQISPEKTRMDYADP